MLLFVGRLNTYLTTRKSELLQQHLCAFHDADALPPLTEKDMKQHGYSLQRMGENLFIFRHVSKGVLILSPDLGISHSKTTIPSDSYVRKIPSHIIPLPPPTYKIARHIAKNIHQTGYPAEFPEHFLENRNNLVLNNPDFKYRYWQDEKKAENNCSTFIEKYYGSEILKYYTAINPCYGAAKGDLFRYLCIYALGGVYLDIKSTISLPISKIIRPNDTMLLSFFPRKECDFHEIRYIKYSSEYQQFFIIAQSGHPLIKRIIHQVLCNIKLYDPLIHGVGGKTTLMLTGPIVYSRIINSFRKTYKTRLISSLSEGIDYSILPLNAHRDKLCSPHYDAQDSNLIFNPSSL